MGEIGKFAYVGTTCTGKTTLLERSSWLNGGDVLLVTEAAREYFSARPNVTDRFSVETQGEIQALIRAKEQRAHTRAQRLGHAVALICDRSVLDAPAYVHSQGDKRGAAELLDRVQLWTPTYTTIFLLDPADVPYEVDDIRNETEETRRFFHEAFVDFFGENGIPYELLSGTVEERLATVGDHIAATTTS